MKTKKIRRRPKLLLTNAEMAALVQQFPIGSQCHLSPRWVPGGMTVTVERIDWDGWICVCQDLATDGNPWPDGKFRHRVRTDDLVK